MVKWFRKIANDTAIFQNLALEIEVSKRRQEHGRNIVFSDEFHQQGRIKSTIDD